MRLSVLSFLWFSASKCSYVVLIYYEIFLSVHGKNYYWHQKLSLIEDIGDIEYFNATLDEHKIIYLNGTYYYITKDDFDGIQVLFCK